MDAFKILARADPNGDCTQATCDVSQSIYGYRPSLAATIVFLVLFAFSGIAHTWQGIATRTWFFSTAMVIGCLSEVLGYIAKIMLWNDPFSPTGFKLSVVVLTFAPAFYSAGLYYMLKHIAITFGSSFSRLRPSLYTWIFISCDLFSIVLQAIGGGIASGAEDDSTLNAADNVLIAGLATQVFTLIVFGLCILDYAIKVQKHKQELVPETTELRRSMKFRLFLLAIVLSYTMILIRCAYRLAELAKGWSPDNEILRSQGLFIGLDSVPCAIASIILNFWHPGRCFPKEKQAAARQAIRSGSDTDGSDEKSVQV